MIKSRYIRCFATDDIINSLTEAQNDHLDGDNSNNRLSNLTLIRSKNNEIKSDLTYEKFFEEAEKMVLDIIEEHLEKEEPNILNGKRVIELIKAKLNV